MVRGLYVAANSLLVQEARHDTIASNLANVSTPGYRRAITSVESFPAVLGRVSALPAAGQAVPHLSARQTTDFTPGAHLQTDNPCDLALDGPGFFVVDTAAGEAYTRSGSFTLDAEGHLATSSGHRLLGNGGLIKVAGRNWSVKPTGDVICDGAVIDRIRVVDLEPGRTLSRMGENLFTASGDDAPAIAEGTSIRQGYVEGSNVNAISEMVHMIAALRAFEANQKIIQAVDQTLDQAVNQIGRV